MAAFRWVLHDAGGSDVRATESFSTREEAEEWMGENWSDLLAEGAETVSLMSDQDQLYEMGLREA